ncbi:GH12 family glycosyl hydrolase domain-containing protein [Amycolatopsis sp. NPDC004772]
MSRRGKFAAALAAVSLLLGVVLAASADTTSPKMVTGVGSCTTDANGICAIAHTLGTIPDTVVVSANTPGQYNGFLLNTVQGSYTEKTFKVRAMFAQTKPKTFGTIWISYIASVGMGTPPPPPPTSATTSPGTTTPTTAAPPSSTAPPTTTVTPSSTTAPTTTTTPPACANPEKIVEQDGRTFDAPGTGGQYYVHNDAWNWQGPNSGQHELLYLCNQANWYVDSWGFDTPEGEVFMYPSTKFDVTGSCCAGKALSTWPNQVLGRFAGTVSGYDNTSSYNVAWDLWLNGVASGNYTELMIWTQRGGNAAPAGQKQNNDYVAPNGQVYEIWWDGNTYAQPGGSYLAFISKTPQLSGTVDIRAFIAESAARGYINANPTLNQLNYGIEVRDTGSATSSNPARFTLTDFALTLS